MANAEGIIIPVIQLLALKQVLEMDVNHNMPNAYGIQARDALANLGLVAQDAKLSKKKKKEWLDQVTLWWNQHKQLEAEEKGNDA